MPFYEMFTTTRTTPPDMVVLTAAVKASTSDSTCVIFKTNDGPWRSKKDSPWTPSHIAAVQTNLDTTTVETPKLSAQRVVDRWPIETRALLLALLDQINVLRAALPVPLNPITPAQAIAAVRSKAGTL